MATCMLKKKKREERERKRTVVVGRCGGVAVKRKAAESLKLN